MNTANNLIPNADFSLGELGGLPEHWSLYSAQPYLTPRFELALEEGGKSLLVAGNGNENGVGWIWTQFPMAGNRTYRMTVRFRASADVNPYRHLLFSFYAGREWEDCNNGIFEFRQTSEGEYEGENTFFVYGPEQIEGEIRIACRLLAEGSVHVTHIGLEQADPLPERNVRVACVQGFTSDTAQWDRVVDRAAELGANLMLLPETFTGDKEAPQPIDGECASFMARKAREHRMYMAGTFVHRDAADGHLYNTGLMFDREGDWVGRYDKIHLYSPELMNMGITPGKEVPVFRTEFGVVGMMICYDSWFPDIAELLALKGAELILFPNAGYYRSLLPARANDNGVRVVSSSMYATAGVWDTSGADAERPDMDPSRSANNGHTFKDVVRERMDGFELLVVTLDMNESPSAHNWGGPMLSAPGGRRNRREQKRLLYEEIQAEVNRKSVHRMGE